MRLASITIDADGSPSGHIAWYNHSTNHRKIRSLRPMIRNGRYGVQRMEMLAIYFALADNLQQIDVITNDNSPRKKNVVVNIRSDSKTSVEQLQGISKVRDNILQRICAAIRNLLDKLVCRIVFNYLDRARNIAGLLLEQRRRIEEERRISYLQEKLDAASGLPRMSSVSIELPPIGLSGFLPDKPSLLVPSMENK